VISFLRSDRLSALRPPLFAVQAVMTPSARGHDFKLSD
jgi:hypothetical protein